MIRHAPVTLEIHTIGMDTRRAMLEDVRRGLARAPKELPCRYFYDERGSELFDEITELPEYYLYRAETEILSRHAGDIANLARPEAIVELGAGACTKTRLLLGAACRAGDLRWFVPFDISEGPLRRSAGELAQEFEGLSVHCIVGDFGLHLSEIPRFGRQLVVFLGSTIGNFEDAERHRFLASIRRLMVDGDRFLLGVDLVKDEAELVAAYDDAQGVTADFNRNVLRVLNRELGADFDPDRFDHLALWNAARSRMEMHLVARGAQRVSIPAAPMRVALEDGEAVRTEISVKFTRESVERFFADAGLRLSGWFTDEGKRFALALGEAAPNT
jgi:L-histidine N-alpha-methyltransferase